MENQERRFWRVMYPALVFTAGMAVGALLRLWSAVEQLRAVGL